MAAEPPLDPSTRLRRDIGRHLRGAFLLVAIGLTLGVTLIPRGDELLLIHVRNRDIDRARRVLADGGASGVATVSSVVAHGELYLLEGRVDDALSELERFVAQHRDNAAAWRRLARLYRYAQRPDDQVRALAEVYRLEPSPDLARELLVLYRWNGDETREAVLLRALVTGGHADVDEARRSARLEAALGRLDVALATLTRLADQEAQAFEYADLDLFVSLLVDAGRSASLGERVQRLPLVRREPATLSQLAVAMRRRGWTEQAVQLFTAPKGVALAPVLLAGRARAARGSKAAPDVLRELLDIDVVRALGEEPLEAAVRLALSLGDDAAVDQLLFRLDGGGQPRPSGAVPPSVVAAVVGEAVSRGDRARAQRLIARFGDEGLAESPLLALELAVERDDRHGALSWIERIDKVGQADPFEVAAVAQLEAGLGLELQAFARLAYLIPTGSAPAWALSDFTRLAARLSRVDEALRVLAPGRGSDVAPERRRVWATLAASGHRPNLLAAWLERGTIGPDDAAALQDSYYLQADSGDPALAARLAERLFAVRGSADDLVLMSQALIAVGRPADALAPLRASGLRDARLRAAYDAALTRAVEARWEAGERASLIEDVEALASRDLDRWLSALVESAEVSGRRATAVALIARADGGLTAVDDRRRADRVRALVELEAPDGILLPELRRLAYDGDDGWVFVYDERLERAARTSERVELWAAVGSKRQAPEVLRRSAASRLVDLKAPSAAADIFERLAANAGPGDADVQQLLYLWATTQAADRQVEWLVARLQAAPLADRAAWVTHLIAAGAAAKVVAAFPELPEAAPQALAMAWLDAHRAAGDPAALRAALASTIAWRQAETDTLRHAGRIALAESLPDAAAAAFRLVAAREPGDRDAARWVGTLAFYERRTVEAREFLRIYEALGGNDAEPLFQLGELAREERRDTHARIYYVRALDSLSDTSIAAVRPLRANILVRLGQRSRASDEFEAHLHDAPGSDHVRADFASALLQWGEYDRAWHVLETQPRPSPGVTADVAGTRRLDLLRLQWLNVAGRYTAAQRLLETLEARFSDDVDVRLARASFDASRGRRAQADDQYAAVRRDAPDRLDVAALVRTREQELAPRASLQTEARGVSSSWSASSTSTSVEGRLSRQIPVTFVTERLQLTAQQVLGADGRAVPLDRTLTRFEAGITRPLAPGAAISAAVFGTGSGAGAGTTIERHDLRGAWKATAERGRPFWELVESVAGDGRKDRLGIQRDWRFSADAAGWVVLDSNRYRLSSGASASTTAFTLGLVRTVRHGAPTLTVQYGIDKEHVRAHTLLTAADGRLFAPVPLVSREVHLAGATTRFPIRRLWDLDASAGYTVDRFGGRGSFLTARATALPSARVGLDLWGERRLYSLATTQRGVRGGARMTVRLGP